MVFSIIIAILILSGLAIVGIQNSIPIEIEFFIWKFQLSLSAVIFYSSLFGGAIIAVLTAPKMVSKHLKVKSLNKELSKLKEQVFDIEAKKDKKP
jgi:uncharacterized integral membrane protein